MNLKIFIAILLVLQFVHAQRQYTVAIIGSNDLHGKAFPASMIKADTGEEYKYGGLATMASIIDIIRGQNKGNTLYLDAGDQFQGGIEASTLISSGEIMTDYYNGIGLSGYALGNHQFDIDPQFLLRYMQEKQAFAISGNIRSQKGEINFLPKQKTSVMYKFDNGIRVGVIGLTTIQTPSASATFTDGVFPSYQFLQYKNIILEENQKLRAAGANAVIVVSHVGDSCPVDLQYKFRTNQTKQQPCNKDQITKMIESLPKGTIDGIVQGHRHVMAHHYYDHIPYMGSIDGGYYLNVLYLTFNSKKELKDTYIQGPIPVCQKIFTNTGKCNYIPKQLAPNAGKLVDWKFHNKDVKPNQKIENLFNTKWLPLMEPYLKKVVVTQINLKRQRTKQSELGNLFTNLLHQAAPEADFALCHDSGFRTEWLPGVIQYQHFFNMFPFENQLQTFDITGSELLEMLKIIQAGKKAFYHFWNLQMIVSYNKQTNKKAFISARFMDGTQIDPNRMYKGVSYSFLLNGGDDFQNVINKVYTPRNIVSKGDYRDLVQQQLIEMQIIKEGTLIDPQHPRLIVRNV